MWRSYLILQGNVQYRIVIKRTERNQC